MGREVEGNAEAIVKKKPPVEATNFFVCTCSPKTEMTNIEALAHLKTFHKIERAKGTRTMIAHLDCADSYSSTYEWKFGDVTMHQYLTNPRTKRTEF